MRSMFRSVLVMLVPMFLTMGVGTALAAATPTYLCVPETAGQAVTSGGSEGKCEAKTKSLELPPAEDFKFVAEGIGKKPTIEFSGLNVQIVDGEGHTGTTNGAGNLVIGYDEFKPTEHEQTGSHNLIFGSENTFKSYGGIVGGFANDITAPYASIIGGWKDTASGEFSSVSGAYSSTASGRDAAVSGGDFNIASAQYASVSGGASNTAGSENTSVSGGSDNTANKDFASVSGGVANTASGEAASVSGGLQNTASGSRASVSGGYKNIASGRLASIFGGKELKAEKEYEAIP